MHTQARILIVLAIVPVLFATGVVRGQSDEGEQLHQSLKSIQEQIETLRRDNEAIKARIDDLRAQSDSDWLTQARADEIRGLVQDVLADADTRANLLQDGIMAGWSENFYLSDAFGRFLLQIDGLLQTRFIYNYRDQLDNNRSGFEVTRTRLTFRGHVFNENLQYLVRGEMTPHPPQGIAAGVFHLLDAWGRYSLTDEWSVRVGQFKLPFLREELVSESEQLAVERSLVGIDTSVWRSQAAEIAYHDSANSWSLALSNGQSSRGTPLNAIMVPGGFVTGFNTPALASNTEYAITTRYERLLAGTWSQFNDFTSPIDEEHGRLFGIAMHMQRNESVVRALVGNNEPWMIALTGDYSMEWGGANGFLSATYIYTDTPAQQILHFVGIVAQAGAYFTPKVEGFIRGEWIQVEGSGGSTIAIPDMGIITIGCNYYIEGHDVKWTTDVGFSLTEVSQAWSTELAGWRDVSQNGAPEIVFRTQLQILF